jgi:hypothetical protein
MKINSKSLIVYFKISYIWILGMSRIPKCYLKIIMSFN